MPILLQKILLIALTPPPLSLPPQLTQAAHLLILRRLLGPNTNHTNARIVTLIPGYLLLLRQHIPQTLMGVAHTIRTKPTVHTMLHPLYKVH
jgi:hypothetical protein